MATNTNATNTTMKTTMKTIMETSNTMNTLPKMTFRKRHFSEITNEKHAKNVCYKDMLAKHRLLQLKHDESKNRRAVLLAKRKPLLEHKHNKYKRLKLNKMEHVKVTGTTDIKNMESLFQTQVTTSNLIQNTHNKITQHLSDENVHLKELLSSALRTADNYKHKYTLYKEMNVDTKKYIKRLQQKKQIVHVRPPTCGDSGGMTQYGDRCRSYTYLNDEGRCRHHLEY